jgi:hypothetical protein
MALAQCGGTRYSNLALAATKAVVVAGPVLLFNILGYNSGGAASYLQFFDALTADVTVGSTTPTFVIPLPASGGYDAEYQLPEGFRIGIVIACTATATGSGAPGAAAMVKLGYTGG